jgi:predicted nucleic acid-binding protein
MTSASAKLVWSLDSNIVLYCHDHTPEAATKKRRAQMLLAASIAHRNVLAGQVCGEVFRVLHSKVRLPALRVMDFMSKLIDQHAIAVADATVFSQAMELSIQTKRQFWDCLIIATCAAQGVKRLYTEDTGAEPHVVLGLELVNPFLMENWDEAFEFA